MMSPESYPYPAREHYEFPEFPSGLLRQEYELYPSREDTLRMMIGLRNMYKATAFMKSMKRYSEFALAVKTEDGDVTTRPPQNNEFYAGTLLALHGNITVQPARVKSHILAHDFLSDVTKDNPAKSDIETDITEWLETWIAGDDNNWSEYFSETSRAYQQVATEFAERLYPNSDEDQLDFMAGFAHGTNMFSQTSVPVGPPV